MISKSVVLSPELKNLQSLARQVDSAVEQINSKIRIFFNESFNHASRIKAPTPKVYDYVIGLYKLIQDKIEQYLVSIQNTQRTMKSAKEEDFIDRNLEIIYTKINTSLKDLNQSLLQDKPDLRKPVSSLVAALNNVHLAIDWLNEQKYKKVQRTMPKERKMLEKCEHCGKEKLPLEIQLAILEKIAKKEKYPWQDCINDQLKDGYSKESAEKICGKIRARSQGLG